MTLSVLVPLLADNLYLLYWIAPILLGLFVLYGLGVVLKYAWMCHASRVAGSPMGVRELIRLQRHNIDPRQLIAVCRYANVARLELSAAQLEKHLSNGGRPTHVIDALTLARSAKIRIGWAELCRSDLAGQDAVQVVQQRIDALKPT